jgi:zinc transporter ZupT
MTIIKHSNLILLFSAIATHKFVITFCVGLELATNDTKLVSFIAYMITFCLASPLGIGIGIAVSEASMLENPAHHFLTISALQGIKNN